MRLTTLLSLIASIGVVLIVGCSGQKPIDAADSIYTGGDIVTMNDKQPTAEALAVKGAQILAVGTRADVEKAHKGAATRIVDLGGKTLLPVFLDAHSHYISSLTVANQVNVYTPPAGPGKDPESIVAELVKYRDKNKISKGEVIQAYGYDQKCRTAACSTATTWTRPSRTTRCCGRRSNQGPERHHDPRTVRTQRPAGQVRAVQGPAVAVHPAHLLLRRGPYRQPRHRAGDVHEPDA